MSEFEKIAALKESIEPFELNLWFEDDLFCQTNFWFTCQLIAHYKIAANLFLVRSGEAHPYSFAAHKPEALMHLFQNRTPINSVKELEALWQAYRAQNISELVRIATHLQGDYPFILQAVNAYVKMQPIGNDKGYIYNVLQDIISQLNGNDFGSVFKAFCKREPIYGFGDVQLKELMISFGMLEATS